MFRGGFDGSLTDGTRGTGFSCGTAILPYIEQSALYGQFDLNLPVTNTSPSRNLTLAQTHLPIFTCPSDFKPKNFTDGAVIDSATNSYKACGTTYDGWPGNGVRVHPSRHENNGLL